MCMGTGEELRVVWCSKGCETEVYDVTLAVQPSNGQHSERGKGEFGVQLEGSKVQFLLFADDLVLVAENEEDTKRNVEVLNEVITKINGRPSMINAELCLFLAIK